MLIKKWEQLPEEMRIPALRPYYDVLRAHSGSLVLKRAFDLAGSIVLLGLLSPAFLAISAAVALDSKGGVFFTQERVTAYNRHFQIIKFRTMVPDAESMGAQLTTSNDMRVTRVGRFLRNSRLDELPQLINKHLAVGHRSQTALRYINPARHTEFGIRTSDLPAIKIIDA